MERRNLPNPTVKQRSMNARLHKPPHTHLHKLGKIKTKQGQAREGERRWRGERKRGEGAAEGRTGTGLSVRCPEFQRTWCHPHDRAVCRGHLPHYGKCMHLGQARHGQGKWHTGNYYWVMLASSTRCTCTYCTGRQATSKQRVLLNGVENFESDSGDCANISHEFRLGKDFFEQAVA